MQAHHKQQLLMLTRTRYASGLQSIIHTAVTVYVQQLCSASDVGWC
jgi:hypothetical protein